MRKWLEEAFNEKGYSVEQEGGVYKVLRSTVPIFVARNIKELKAFLAGYEEGYKRAKPGKAPCRSSEECIIHALDQLDIIHSNLKKARWHKIKNRDEFDDAMILVVRLRELLKKILEGLE